MATQSVPLPAEFEQFAAPFIESGRYPNSTEVLHAAMEALQRQVDEQAYDEACARATEEGEASGLFEGDIFEAVRANYGWKPFSV